MLGTGPSRKVGAAFADKSECKGRADTVDLRQIYAQHAVQRRAHLKIRRVDLSPFGSNFRISCPLPISSALSATSSLRSHSTILI